MLSPCQTYTHTQQRAEMEVRVCGKGKWRLHMSAMTAKIISNYLEHTFGHPIFHYPRAMLQSAKVFKICGQLTPMTTCWCYGCVFVTSSFAYIAAFQMEFIARSIIIWVFPCQTSEPFTARIPISMKLLIN